MAHVLANDLRAAILQAAIQGNLTTQKDSDSDVYELISNAAKAMSSNEIDGRKVKKKNLSNNTINREFDIPDNWAWVQLGSICVIARGGSPRPIKSYLTNDESGVNWIKIGDTEKNGKYISSTKEKIIPEGVKKSRYVKAGDFLLTNSMSFGRPYILKIDGCIHDGWLVISQPYEVFIPDYLYYLLSSAFAYKQFCGLTSGAVVQNLNGDKVANAFFPLPPIEEQARIVAKVDEIMAKIDEYEKLENQLVKLKEQFPQDMKDSLLQAGMMGKLTEQYHSEHSPLRNLKNDTSEYDSDLPSNWSVAKMMTVSELYTGNSISESIKKSKYTGLSSGYNYIGTKDVGFDCSIAYNNGVKIPYDEPKFKIAKKHSTLLCIEGGSAGKKVGITSEDVCFGNKLCSFNAREYINYKFQFYVIQSPTFKKVFIQNKSGMIGGVSIKKLKEILIPLPPIEEQQRIVDKLDELLPLVDKLAELN